MNGIDLMNNLIDELERAKESLLDQVTISNSDYELITSIRIDLNRYYNYADSFNAVLGDINILTE